MTSDAQTRSRDEEAAPPDGAADGSPAHDAPADLPDHRRDGGTDGSATDGGVTGDEETGRGRKRRALQESVDDEPRSRSRLALPLVPTLSVLLALLLAAGAFLWFTRPEPSEIGTQDYKAALAEARSDVVDMTSWDYLTLDDDIEQIRRVTTGDLRDQAVKQLDSQRKAITDAQTVVNTKVVSAGVTRADDSDATVVMVIQSTQESAGSDQAQLKRYQIEVDLVKQDGRWILSAIAGTGKP